jgi:hypothetical protein
MNCLDLAKWCCRTTPPAPVFVLAAVIGAIAFSSGAGAQTDERRLATPSELRQMHDAGQYRICLQQIARVLRSGNAARNHDRYDLLLLRGECLLGLEDPATARLAYEAAAKSPVPDQAREGRATALLLQRSTKLTYLPRSDNDAQDGINVASKEGRTRALRALLASELRAGEPDFRRASSAENLVPIFDVLPRLADLYAVERTATGGDVKLRPILEAIGQRARTLIERELDLREQSIIALESRANQRIDAPAVAGRWWWGGDTRRGLYTPDRRELRDLIDYVQRVEEAAKLGQELAVSFDADAKLWDPLITRASKAVRYAQDVLDAE